MCAQQIGSSAHGCLRLCPVGQLVQRRHRPRLRQQLLQPSTQLEFGQTIQPESTIFKNNSYHFQILGLGKRAQASQSIFFANCWTYFFIL